MKGFINDQRVIAIAMQSNKLLKIRNLYTFFEYLFFGILMFCISTSPVQKKCSQKFDAWNFMFNISLRTFRSAYFTFTQRNAVKCDLVRNIRSSNEICQLTGMQSE